VVAGFPALPDWARIVLAGVIAVVSGAVAVLESRRDDGATGRRELLPVAPVPRLLLKPELFQLPPDITNFTNQEGAVRQIVARVADERAPGEGPAICVISGKGGVGKTATAVHIAHRLRASFPAGQLYVNLRGMDEQPLDASEVLEEFLREFGVEPSFIPRRLEDRTRMYRSQISRDRLLIVLDNAADEIQVRPLIPWAPNCAVLVTSRRRLPGLLGAELVPLDVLDQDAALTLLGSIVGRPRLDTESDAARSIVQLCGGLPLAVKVAGAKLVSRPHWRIARLTQRLQDGQSRLRELQIGDMEVQSVMALSYNTRPERERQVFRRLGLLHSPTFSAWAVSALVEGGLRHTEDTLESLVEVHLVEVAGEDAAGQMHYRLHDLLRDFARERVLEEEMPEDRLAALRRYIAAYLAVTTEAWTRLEPGMGRDTDAAEWRQWQLPGRIVRDALPDDPVNWFSYERANLAAIVQQAFDSGLAALGWPLLARLSPFCEHQAHWDLWRDMAQAALDAATRLGNRRAEAQARYELGWVARFEGRFPDSIEQLQASSSGFFEVNEQKGRARALNALGIVLTDSGRWRQAVAAYEESLGIFQQSGDQHWVARTRQELGVLYRLQGEWQQASDLLNASITVFRALGDRHREARALRALADVQYERGRFEDALATLNSVLPMFRALGDRRWEATTTMRIGEVYSRQGRLDEALAALEQAQSVLRKLGDRRWDAVTTLRMGEVYGRRGRLDDALAAFESVLPVFREMDDRRFGSIAILGIGEVRTQQGQLRDAVAAFDQALSVFRELRDHLRLAETFRARGRARAAGNERNLAIEDFQSALELFEWLGRDDDAQETQAELARLDSA